MMVCDEFQSIQSEPAQNRLPLNAFQFLRLQALPGPGWLFLDL